MAKTPIFQARHYRFLAQLLHELKLNDGQHWHIVEKFISELKSDNGNFNAERFEYAVTHGVNSKARQTTKPRRPSSLGALAGSTYGHFAVSSQKGRISND